MEILNKTTAFIQNLNQALFQKYLIAVLASFGLLSLTVTYYTYSTSTELVDQIKRIGTLSSKSAEIIEQEALLAQEQKRLLEIFDKEKDFNIKIYFEQFCKEQMITPELGWGDSIVEINDKISEIVLRATFKGQNTEKLARVLDALSKKEIIYVKEVTVRHEPPNRITFDLKIATIRYKKD